MKRDSIFSIGESRFCAKLWYSLAPAFTLVEVMVVIAVVSIFAVLLFPAMKSALAASGRAACSGNLRQIGVAVALYAGEHRMSLPPGSDYVAPVNPDGSTGRAEINGNAVFPAHYMDLGMKPWKTFACPTDQSRPEPTRPGGRWPNYTSYAQNYAYLVSYTNGVPETTDRRPIPLAEAQKKILYVDGIDPLEAESWEGGWPPPNVNGNGVAGALLSRFVESTISRRHNGNVNALFGDGSVRVMTKEEACLPHYLDRD